MSAAQRSIWYWLDERQVPTPALQLPHARVGHLPPRLPGRSPPVPRRTFPLSGNKLHVKSSITRIKDMVTEASLSLVRPCGIHCRRPCVTHYWHRLCFVHSWKPCCSAEQGRHFTRTLGEGQSHWRHFVQKWGTLSHSPPPLHLPSLSRPFLFHFPISFPLPCHSYPAK